MSTAFAAADVAAFEHATWSRCAPGYEDGFAHLTREAVEPLLDAAGVSAGSRVLDIGTGSGVAAARARARGATVTGIDFSDAMLAEARRTVQGVEFRSGSADALPFADASYDAVVANATLHHLGDPEKALGEAHRVLAPGGRIACTVWAAPESLDAFGIFFAAVGEHAGSAELPHGPLFGVTDHATLTALFAGAGFTDVTIETLPTSWRMASIDELLRALGTWGQLDTFPEAVRAKIDTTVRAASTRYEADGGLVIPNPMLLIAAARD